MSDQPETRHVGIAEFVVHDIDERTGPPSKPVLRVSLIGRDLLSLAIEAYDEDAKVSTFTRKQSIVVDLEPFYNGLRACLASAGRKPR